MATQAGSVNTAEIAQFSKDANRWWDESGPFAPLHRLNPVRLSHIRDQICGYFDLDTQNLKPYRDLQIIDVGCGGGIVCEPIARLGAQITGVDADKTAIEVAREHAAESGLDIAYRHGAAEDIQEQFDVVLALEIIEHVNDPAGFVKTVAGLARPGGLVIFSTLNRTPKSFALGIVAAEYILGWVPRGTHSWKKFVKPSELSRMSRSNSLEPQDIKGLIFNPLSGDFQMSDTDIDVNYFLTAVKADS